MPITNQTNRESMDENNVCKESQAYYLIKNSLAERKYPSGTILSERRLSEVYQMSRTPIRDALRQLTHEGLLKFVPGKGAIVPEYTIEDILEVYDLMEILQKHAARRCIQNIKDIPMQKLGDILLNLHNALKSDNLNDFVKWDKDFHAFLILHSNNQRLSTLYGPLDDQSSQFKATVSEDKSQAERSYMEHEEIYDAILSRNIDEVEKALTIHYKNIKQYHIDKLIYRIS